MIEIENLLCYSPQFVADLLDRHLYTVYKMIHDGRIKATQLGGPGGHWTILGIEVKRLIGQNQEEEQDNEKVR